MRRIFLIVQPGQGFGCCRMLADGLQPGENGYWQLGVTYCRFIVSLLMHFCSLLRNLWPSGHLSSSHSPICFLREKNFFRIIHDTYKSHGDVQFLHYWSTLHVKLRLGGDGVVEFPRVANSPSHFPCRATKAAYKTSDSNINIVNTVKSRV